MRKQATASRIRKKATNTANPSSTHHHTTQQFNYADPFHNGQTPACRQLLRAIQDVFPELQQQMKHQTPSSHLGQLLRWQFLTNRKARQMPPAPPLASASTSPPPTENKSQAAVPPTKRKKKRKKKKKQDSNGAENAESGGEYNANNNNNNNSAAFDERSLAELSVEILDEAIDKSLSEHETQMLQATAEADSLLRSLPSDDKIEDHEHSTSVFFEQIIPQSASNMDDDLNGIPSDLNDMHTLDANNSNGAMMITGNSSTASSAASQATNPQTPTQTKAISVAAAGLVTPPRPSPKRASSSDSISKLLNSPNHEWVPQEGAESKQETPPGEVIKNPLDLPFLLTLTNSDSGVTTTTIEGSLIFAEKSSGAAGTNRAEGPSSFETTKALFEEWLNQVDDDSPQQQDLSRDYRSFLEYLQKRLHGGTQASGIAFQALKDAVSGIECGPCKQDAMAELDNLEKNVLSSSVIVLNPTCLRDKKPDESVDAAFDYVALEEGHHLPNTGSASSVNSSENEDEPDKETNLCLVIVDPKQKKISNNSSGKQLYLENLTEKQMNKLVELWLLCGIEEEIMVTTPVDQNEAQGGKGASPVVLDFDEISALQETALETEAEARKTFGELQTLGKEMIAEFATVTSSAQANNIELGTFPILKNCDDKCSQYMDQILEILTFCTSEQSHSLAEVQLHLWTTLLEGLNKTLDACDSYYSKVQEQMADQLGVVPKMFVSAPLRSLFHDLVEEKIRLWTNMGSIFADTLSNRVLKEWFTCSAWEHDRLPKIESGDSAALDDNCHDLVVQLFKWTDTILGGRVAEIQRERMSQTEHILELLQAAIEPLSKDYATVERFFSKDRNNYFASLRSNVVLAQGVKKRMRLIDHKEVKCMATGVILMWRHVRIMQSKMILSKKIPPLPLQLKRWMLQEEGALNDWRHGSSTGQALDPNQLFCQIGKGGKRRVTCVMAGLIYKWLEEKCMEWKAEKAEKELLTGMDYTTPLNDSPPLNEANNNALKSGKANKKNKKKKNKNQPAAAVAVAIAPTIAEENVSSNGIDERPKGDTKENINSNENSNQIEPPPKETHSESSVQTSEKLIEIPNGPAHKANGISPQHQNDSATNTKTPNKEENGDIKQQIMEADDDDDADTDTAMIIENELLELDEQCFENVNVLDKERKISARDFFTSRLQVLMNSASNKNSDIIVIQP